MTAPILINSGEIEGTKRDGPSLYTTIESCIAVGFYSNTKKALAHVYYGGERNLKSQDKDDADSLLEKGLKFFEEETPTAILSTIPFVRDQEEYNSMMLDHVESYLNNQQVGIKHIDRVKFLSEYGNMHDSKQKIDYKTCVITPEIFRIVPLDNNKEYLIFPDSEQKFPSVSLD